jgi:hypothetical protein
MLRQRIRQRTNPLAFFGRLLTFVFAAALVWYGAMVVLGALKVSPATINSISGYRTAYNYLAGLTPDKVDGATTRAILAAAGVLAFLLFGYLAFKEIPRPRLTRHDLELVGDGRGELTVEPRAIERLAETAARQDPAITSVSGRYAQEDLTVSVTVRRARNLAPILRDAQHRVRDALKQHELPTLPVNVTLAGYDRRHRRELN